MLTPKAQAKFNDLRSLVVDAGSRTAAARAQLPDLDARRSPLAVKKNNGKSLFPEEASALEVLDREHAAIVEKIRVRHSVYATLSQLALQVERFMEENAGRQVVDAPSPNIEAGETVASVREKIATCKGQIASLKRVRLGDGDMTEILRRYVAEQGERGRPVITGADGLKPFRVTWNAQNPWPLLAWLDPDKLVQRLLDELPKSEGEGMSAYDKAERLKGLHDELLSLERIEEALIEAFPFPLDRRVDADPRAVLGIAVI